MSAGRHMQRRNPRVRPRGQAPVEEETHAASSVHLPAVLETTR